MFINYAMLLLAVVIVLIHSHLSFSVSRSLCLSFFLHSLFRRFRCMFRVLWFAFCMSFLLFFLNRLNFRAFIVAVAAVYISLSLSLLCELVVSRTIFNIHIYSTLSSALVVCVYYSLHLSFGSHIFYCAMRCN